MDWWVEVSLSRALPLWSRHRRPWPLSGSHWYSSNPIAISRFLNVIHHHADFLYQIRFLLSSSTSGFCFSFPVIMASNFPAIYILFVSIFAAFSISRSSTIGVGYISPLLEIQGRERSPAQVQVAAARGVLRRLLPSHLSSFDFQIVSKVFRFFLQLSVFVIWLSEEVLKRFWFVLYCSVCLKFSLILVFYVHLSRGLSILFILLRKNVMENLALWSGTIGRSGDQGILKFCM